MSRRTAAIVGTGLIGSSVGLSMAASGWNVTGWDPDPDALAQAAAMGAVAKTAESRDEAIAAGPDLVVLAGPPLAVEQDVASLDTRSLVIDVAGVKSPIVAANRLPRFIGTHPMAGRETAGPTGASAALFRGAAWVIVTDGAEPGDLDTVEAIVTSAGAVPIRMSARDHDAAVAAVSHLPQVLASVLMSSVAADPAALALAAGSFRDLTRVAASDPGMWKEVLVSNRAAVGEAISRFRDVLEIVATSVERGAVDDLAAFLAGAQGLRRGLAPPVVGVRVSLADQPGELARVGRAFERSSVDVRDLQLRHATHGGPGVLTVSVRPGEAEALRAALVAEGLLLAE